jgi:hypothetical protein
MGGFFIPAGTQAAVFFLVKPKKFWVVSGHIKI